MEAGQQSAGRTVRAWTEAQHDEQDQLRDQFRQLFRYRKLVLIGLLVGLLGGGWLGVEGRSSSRRPAR